MLFTSKMLAVTLAGWLSAGIVFGADTAGSVPQVEGHYGHVPREFQHYQLVVPPPVNTAEWWAGAPSVVRDAQGTFWLACRMRTAEGPRGRRGYALQLMRSADGIHFQKVKTIRRQEVPIPGFERPSLVIDPQTKRFKLYACGPWKNGPWSIIKFADADTPGKVDPHSAHRVIGPRPLAYPRDIRPVEYKDPFIIYAQGKYHAYVIGYLRKNERVYHFQSRDGEHWEPVGDYRKSIMQLTGWHDFFIRPSCVLPVGTGYLFIYEGSSTSWYDPVYNVVTGLGFTFDLQHVIDLTPDSPLVVSSTPSAHFATFRYSDWLWVNSEIWVYAEVTRANDAHEIRLYRLPRLPTLQSPEARRP